MTRTLMIAFGTEADQVSIDSAISSAQRLYTRSEYLHAVLYFPHSELSASVTEDKGVHLMKERTFSRDGYEFVSVEVSNRGYKRALKFAKANRNGRYNCCAYYCFPCGCCGCLDARNKFTCSQFVSQALVKAGALKKDDLGRGNGVQMTPGELYDILDERGGMSGFHPIRERNLDFDQISLDGL